jgi:hypothetical protein
MISRVRQFAVAPVVLLAACAHGASMRLETAVTVDGAVELRRCIDADECRDIAARMQTRLRQRLDAKAADRLVHQILETLRRRNASPMIGDVIANCRRGHQASCRALWWAIDRLYIDEEATPARANDCPLTQALATAVEL